MRQTLDDALWHARHLSACLDQRKSTSNHVSAHRLAEQPCLESGRNWSQPVRSLVGKAMTSALQANAATLVSSYPC